MAKQAEQSQETIHQSNGISDAEWQGAAPPSNDAPGSGEVLMYMDQHGAIEDEQEKIRTKKNLLRRHMKNRGVPLKEFDQVRRELKAKDPDAIVKSQSELDKMRVWAGLPSGSQTDLFVSATQDEKTRAMVSEAQGYVAGASGTGLIDKPPFELNTIEGQEWTKGWHRGQAELMAQIKELPKDLVIHRTQANAL